MKYDQTRLDVIARRIHNKLKHKTTIVDRDILNCFGERLTNSQLILVSTRVSALRAIQKVNIDLKLELVSLDRS